MKELEDYNWFPKILRRYQMDTIGYLAQITQLYKPISTVLQSLVATNRYNNITDLCSGSGMPTLYLQQLTKLTLPITLTDIYPQIITTLPNIKYNTSSINVLQVQPKSHIIYTMYNAFHHFTTAEQQFIINHFVAHKATLLIVEVLQPTLRSYVSVIVASTVLQLLIAPFIKPFSWLRLLLTYIIPINLLTVLIDGVISVSKSKTKAQYKTLLLPCHSNLQQIMINTIKQPTAILTVITTTPTYA